MFEQLNKVFKNIFSNEETVIFSLVIILFFIVISLFGSILTPFMISIVVAYLLVGLQKKIQSYDVNKNVSLIITFSIFIITGTKQINMLGLKSPYILITEENVPMVRGASQTYGLGFTPGPWIESIQVTKGMGSVTNGFESIVGQINTELKKPLTDTTL